MEAYLSLLQTILDEGVDRDDRTGTGTRSIFGHQMRFDLTKGLPTVTTKKLYLKGVFQELIWFLSGSTNVQYLQDNGVRIWDEWAEEDGELGPVYGHQWRSWPVYLPSGKNPHTGEQRYRKHYMDQMEMLIKRLKRFPESRRHIVSAWNVGDLHKMALPPCHLMFQFYVADGRLSCQLYQRSADCFLGVPFNIVSYATLTHMVAQVCDLRVGDFVHTLGDAHIYHNHFDQVREQLSRTPLPLPTLKLNPEVRDLNDFTYEDIEVVGYQSHPAIKAPIAV